MSFSTPSSALRPLVENFSALFGDAHVARIGGGAFDAIADAGRLPARGHDHDVGDRDGALALRDAALDLFGGVGAGVALDHAHAFHQDSPFFTVHLQHPAGLALVAAHHDLDRVVFFDLDLQLDLG